MLMDTLAHSPLSTPRFIAFVAASLLSGKITLDAAATSADSPIALGQYFSILCSDNQLVTEDAIAADRAAVAVWLQPYVSDGSDLRALCDRWTWKKRPASAFESVTDGIRTLLLSGELDFTTPPQWAREVAAGLKSAQWIEVPGVGHDVSAAGDGCVSKVMGAFIGSPDPVDLSCTHGMRAQFELPDAAGRAERAFSLPGTRLIDRLPRYER
jgi:pimeloyl-ACP methyl ester carboxylesterase